jgi:hypothetical protein
VDRAAGVRVTTNWLSPNPFRPNPTVVGPAGRTQHVKNLGWLLRHWREVEGFHVTEWYDPSAQAFLVANLEGDRQFTTTFASKSVLWAWLNRPVFEGLSVVWGGNTYVLSRRGHDDPRKPWS